MAIKPPETPKPNAHPSSSMLKFLPSGLPRDVGEIILSGIPGGLILALFIVGTAVFNIVSAPSSWSQFIYLPSVCLLPLVVGILAPLILERVRGVDVLSLRRSIISSMLSGLFGSILGALLLIISGLAIPTSKPLGTQFTGPIDLLIFAILLVLISTFLSAIGGAILVLFLSRAMAPKSEG